MKKILFGALGALLLTAAPALAQSPQSCLRVSDGLRFHALNDRALVVETIGHTKYRVNMLDACIDLSWKDQITIRPFGGNLSCVTRGDTVLSREFGGGGPNFGGNNCKIASVELYTPQMERDDARVKYQHDHATR